MNDNLNNKMSQTEKPELFPRLRFPGFNEAWASLPVSKLYSFKGNNSLSRDKLNYIGGTLRNIHYGDIHTKFSHHFNIDAEYVPYINSGESHSSIRQENYCLAGDIILADASEDTADIGKAIEILKTGDIPLVSGLHTILARPKEGFFALGFGAYLFSSEAVRKQIQRESQGTKVLGLSSSRLANVRLHYPTSTDEQLKITQFLSSLDELISAESKKLDALKTHKKGLMQSLFPAEGKMVPKLRFPEFQKMGEWEYALGNKVFDQISNKDHHSDLPVLAVTQEHGAIPRDMIDYHVSVADKSIESYKVVEIGDFIISLRSFQGGIEYSRFKGICSPAYVILRLRKGYSACFFRQFLKTERFIGQLTKNLEGLRDGKMITYKKFSELSLPIPTLPEQHKIANCFSSIDELISVEAKKLDALKAHKKGLMQKLFPIAFKGIK